MVGAISEFCMGFSYSFISKLIGDICPRPECRRRGLYQVSIQVNVAKRSSVFVFQLRRAISSHSKLAKKLSVIALSYVSPTVPMDGRTPNFKSKL
jgi:hypothetical protein